MKRHVYLYVVALEKIQPGQPIALTGNSLAASYLAQCFSTKKMLANDRRTQLPESYSSELLVKVNGNRLSRCYATVPLRSVVALNRFFHRMFIAAMARYTEDAADMGLNGHEAIRRFLELHGIGEDEYSFDAAKKSVFRRKT